MSFFSDLGHDITDFLHIPTDVAHGMVDNTKALTGAAVSAADRLSTAGADAVEDAGDAVKSVGTGVGGLFDSLGDLLPVIAIGGGVVLVIILMR